MGGLIFLLILNFHSAIPQRQSNIVNGEIIVSLQYKYADWPTLKFCGGFIYFTQLLEQYDDVRLDEKNLDSISRLLLSQEIFKVSKKTYIELATKYFNEDYYIYNYILGRMTTSVNCENNLNFEIVYDSCFSQYIYLVDEEMDNWLIKNKIVIPYILYNVNDTINKYCFYDPAPLPDILLNMQNLYDLYCSKLNFYKKYDTEQKLQLLSDSLINSGTFYIDSISFDKPILRNKREDFALIDDNIIYEVIKKYFEQGKYFIYYSNELTEQLYSDASSHSTIVVCYGE